MCVCVSGACVCECVHMCVCACVYCGHTAGGGVRGEEKPRIEVSVHHVVILPFQVEFFVLNCSRCNECVCNLKTDSCEENNNQRRFLSFERKKKIAPWSSR